MSDKKPSENPVAEKKHSFRRVRGGYWNFKLKRTSGRNDLRVEDRTYYNGPSYRHSFNGFRLARTKK